MDICIAIAQGRLVTFTYDGHRRVVIPAAHGSQATTGNNVLRAYQIDGTGSSRTVPFWDLFIVDKILNFQILDSGFDAHPPFYKRGDKHISPIHCEL